MGDKEGAGSACNNRAKKGLICGVTSICASFLAVGLSLLLFEGEDSGVLVVLPLVFFALVAPLSAIAGVVFSVASLRQKRSGRALAGLCLSAVALLLSVFSLMPALE